MTQKSYTLKKNSKRPRQNPVPFHCFHNRIFSSATYAQPYIKKIQSGHSVMLVSTFGQTRSSVLKPDNSHLSDGPLIILSLQLLLMGIKTCSNDMQSLCVV